MFHSWGFAHFSLGLVLSSTYVLQRRFDPEATLAAVERYRPTVMAVVPVMLQRIVQLPEKVRRKYDTSSLRVVAVSGSALPGELAITFMDEFGDILYNLYGSTEVAWASIATPEDLRAAPGTAGIPPRGTVVRLFDDQNQDVAPGGTGRIFVANEMLFDGYTGGDNKANIEGLLSTGDVGHIDANGRLFVEGRDDEMIVSGGENVFPAEVEHLLARHPAVAECSRQGVRSEAQGFCRAPAPVQADRGRGEDVRQVQPRPVQGAARGRVHRRAASQLHRQGPQTRTGAPRARWRGRGPGRPQLQPVAAENSLVP
jgi:fatty-acyl-CoA synthase